MLIFFTRITLIKMKLVSYWSHMKHNNISSCRTLSRYSAIVSLDFSSLCFLDCPERHQGRGGCFSCVVATNGKFPVWLGTFLWHDISNLTMPACLLDPTLYTEIPGVLNQRHHKTVSHSCFKVHATCPMIHPVRFHRDQQLCQPARFSKEMCFTLLVLRSQHTRDIHPMLCLCWASVEDGGPMLKQHWVNAPCLLGWL